MNNAASSASFFPRSAPVVVLCGLLGLAILLVVLVVLFAPVKRQKVPLPIPSGHSRPVLVVTWKCKYSDLPVRVRSYLGRIKSLHPSLDLRYFSDQEAWQWIQRYCSSRVAEAYARINPRYGAARSDLFRYVILYHYGGIYCDLSKPIHTSLESIWNEHINNAQKEGVISYWESENKYPHPSFSSISHTKGELMNWLLVFRSGSPLLRQMIEAVTERILGACTVFPPLRGKGAVLESTGPVLWTHLLVAYRRQFPDRLVEDKLWKHCRYSLDHHSEVGSLSFDLYHQTPFLVHYSAIQDPIFLPGLQRHDPFQWVLYQEDRVISLRMREETLPVDKTYAFLFSFVDVILPCRTTTLSSPRDNSSSSSLLFWSSLWLATRRNPAPEEDWVRRHLVGENTGVEKIDCIRLDPDKGKVVTVAWISVNQTDRNVYFCGHLLFSLPSDPL